MLQVVISGAKNEWTAGVLPNPGGRMWSPAPSAPGRATAAEE